MSLLGRVALSESAIANDEAQAQNAGISTLEGLLFYLDVDPRGARYVAEQRAMRAGLMFEGWSETELLLMTREGIRARDVQFSPEIQAMIPLLAAMWLDGVAAHARAVKAGCRLATQV